MLKKLIKCVREAGRIALKYVGKIKQTEISFKGEKDLITHVDIDVQKYLKNKLKTLYPQTSFLGEEGQASEQINRDKVFIVDPIDGTVNFVHNLPFFAVSLAYAERSVTKIGIIFAPALKLLYYAEKDSGAYCNGSRIEVSKTNSLNTALAATGFACITRDYKPDNLALFSDIIYRILGLRRYGAATLDLCMVADGRIDFYWEYNLNVWDIAAGALIVEEAGGRVTDFKGQDEYVKKRQIIASNGLLHDDFLSIAQKV
jgi:myo-inositol-1(or 4)-monophosphatase